MSEVYGVENGLESKDRHDQATSNTEFHMTATNIQSDNNFNITGEQLDDNVKDRVINPKSEFDETDAGISISNANSEKITSIPRDVQADNIAAERKSDDLSPAKKLTTRSELVLSYCCTFLSVEAQHLSVTFICEFYLQHHTVISCNLFSFCLLLRHFS